MDTLKHLIDKVKTQLEDYRPEEAAALELDMQNVREALKANPQACVTLLPEDLGALVKAEVALQQELVIDSQKRKPRKTGGAGTSRLSKAAAAKLSQELSDDDFAL